MFYMNAAYVGTSWPHPPTCEYICGQHFGGIYVRSSRSALLLVSSSRNAASLPGTILPESLPQLVTQDCRLPPETLELLILFRYPQVIL